MAILGAWRLGGYQLLPNPSSSPSDPKSSVQWCFGIGRRRLWAIVTMVVLVILIAAAHPAKTYYDNNLKKPSSGSDVPALHPPVDPLSVTLKAPGSKGDRRFVFITPQDESNPEMCKLLLPAVALGYPRPIVVNFGGDFGKGGHGFGTTHLAKVTGVLEYLDGMMQKEAHPDDKIHDDDIVVVADSLDMWVQLPPEVLLHRYHEANRRANARLAEQWIAAGGSVTDMPMRQTVIMSAQKKCWPDPSMGMNLHCDQLPESPLRQDLYGPETDHELKEDIDGKEGSRFHNNRVRYINSGNMMGTAKDLKHYLRRTSFKVGKLLASGSTAWSDQGLLGEVLGEQEVWRQYRRDELRAGHGLKDKDEGVALAQEQLEYHVGLDYYQDMFIPTVFEEDDGIIIELGNSSAIADESAKRGINPVRLLGVPEDLAASPNPLDVIDPTAAPHGWEASPVYADFYTEAVPVFMHHNAHRDGLKQRREWWWNRMWYFPRLRELAAQGLKVPETLEPIYSLPAEDGSGDVVYHPPASDATRRLPRLYHDDKIKEGLPEADFNTLCKYKDEKEDSEKHWWHEVFRDDNGPL